MLIEELKRGLERFVGDLKHSEVGCRSDNHTGNASNCKRYHQGSNEPAMPRKLPSSVYRCAWLTPMCALVGGESNFGKALDVLITVCSSNNGAPLQCK